jgi:hypothetical protein
MLDYLKLGYLFYEFAGVLGEDRIDFEGLFKRLRSIFKEKQKEFEDARAEREKRRIKEGGGIVLSDEINLEPCLQK